jgi:hypothetical protein
MAYRPPVRGLSILSSDKERKRMPSSKGSAASRSGVVKVAQEDGKFSSEREFQRAVMRLAGQYGWNGYCHPDSRKSAGLSAPGFPDIILTNQHSILVLELKMPKNKPTDDQVIWLSLFWSFLEFAKFNRLVIVGVFYPHQWSYLEAVIKGGNDV